ncbi:Uncharacterized conserved protein UCP033563 [Candidatus Omnitrophus magneticus]|uniref:Uncharacterized conserved protein UCP033563 n=1 Tax=Candidatus Omnitrophus magneticus TaxID=1609969 RepID=A0A0F0CVW3_9BACT|nr:Uncharacterized conserved protein UCP033563 [Candidatus Omnitrophus magneticus]
MAEIKPFKGILYNSEKIKGEYGNVTAPPYDVISEEVVELFYEKSPYNIIRLILGKSSDNDTPENNKYTRAKKYLNEWIDARVLTKSSEDSFYIYSQEYTVNGEQYHRIGFIGLIKIDEPEDNNILPHEHTHSKPRLDRMKLLCQVKSNLSPIFGLYADKSGIVSKILRETISETKPIIDIKFTEEKHTLWQLSKDDNMKKIISAMKDKKIFIADGHHRYEVAKEYRDLQRHEPGYNGNADYVMMYFADMETPKNLTILPTHRIIKELSGFLVGEEIVKKLNVHFDVKEEKNIDDMLTRMAKDKEKHSFGVFNGKKYYSFTLKAGEDVNKLVLEKKSAEWKNLDVSILHHFVFKTLFKINTKEGDIIYVKCHKDADNFVKESKSALAFFMNETPVIHLKLVAEKGDMMPQKSTYFYPKLLSGLVINKFD